MSHLSSAIPLAGAVLPSYHILPTGTFDAPKVSGCLVCSPATWVCILPSSPNPFIRKQLFCRHKDAFSVGQLYSTHATGRSDYGTWNQHARSSGKASCYICKQLQQFYSTNYNIIPIGIATTKASALKTCWKQATTIAFMPSIIHPGFSPITDFGQEALLLTSCSFLVTVGG